MQKWWKERKRRENSGHWFYFHFGTYFGALSRVHFIHTIYRFEAREVRILTLQTVSKSKLKWKSYGHCKKTGPSWAGISHTSIQGAKIFAPCETLSWHTSAISHTSSPFSHHVKQGANSSVQSVEISHTSIQGAKFIPRCENLSSRCINFAHLNPRCEKFSHRAKHSPGTRVPFRTPQANFRTVRNKVRIPQSKVWKFRTMQFKVRNSHFKVRKFRYCWTQFWSTYWSSNYVYDMSFWSLGSQESSALNGMWFGFETKKLWPFEDNYAKLNGSGAAAANFTTVRHVLEHFLELKLFILYIILKLRKSGIQCFKRCMIWIWNEEVMAVWRRLCKAERKCCSRTKFHYC